MVREFTMNMSSEAQNAMDKLSIKVYEQKDIPVHKHDFFELVYVVEGSGVQKLNGSQVSIRPGDFFIVDYGSSHAYSQCQDLVLINCLFVPEMIDASLKDCLSFDEFIHSCLIKYYKVTDHKGSANHLFYDEDGKVLMLMKGMIEEYTGKVIGYEEVLRYRLLEIIVLTIRKVIDLDQGIIQNDMVLALIDYLNKHYDNHGLVKAFCRDYHYSLQYVSRKFKEECGLTPVQYLQKLRIEKSCQFLAGTTWTVNRIAEEVGYRDVKSFSGLFKKMIKLTPREYRRMNRT